MKHRLLIIAACIVIAMLVFILVQILIVKYNGRPVAVPDVSSKPFVLGAGPDLTYVVVGDSTAIAQGADYEDGYVMGSARHLAQRYTVTTVNLGVSGARADDVANSQIPQAVRHKPDIVLIAVGANDVTHLTPVSSIKASLESAIKALRAANPEVSIIITGSPAMDAVDRFPWTVQRLALHRVTAVNAMVDDLTEQYDVVLAPIAAKTRAAFKEDPSLFAADKFHPNARGYALWTPVITAALDEALASRR